MKDHPVIRDATIAAVALITILAIPLFHRSPAFEDFVIRLSSRNAWQDFFKHGGGDHAHEYEFFQIIDKLERTSPDETEKKLTAMGFSLAKVNEFIEAGKPTTELESILQNLAARGLKDYVKVDYNVIRGLAYYTGVVFEAFDRKGEFRAIRGRRALQQPRQAHQRRQGGPPGAGPKSCVRNCSKRAAPGKRKRRSIQPFSSICPVANP